VLPAAIVVGLAALAAAQFVLMPAGPVRLVVRALGLIAVTGFQPELVISAIGSAPFTYYATNQLATAKQGGATSTSWWMESNT
jgi:hypothetical protein